MCDDMREFLAGGWCGGSEVTFAAWVTVMGRGEFAVGFDIQTDLAAVQGPQLFVCEYRVHSAYDAGKFNVCAERADDALHGNVDGRAFGPEHPDVDYEDSQGDTPAEQHLTARQYQSSQPTAEEHLRQVLAAFGLAATIEGQAPPDRIRLSIIMSLHNRERGGTLRLRLYIGIRARQDHPAPREGVMRVAEVMSNNLRQDFEDEGFEGGEEFTPWTTARGGGEFYAGVDIQVCLRHSAEMAVR